MYYDGGCPLCSREVAHYRRIDVGQAVNWVDIDKHPDELKQHGITLIDAMKHLHVLDSQGEIVKGAYAFQAIWLALPRYRFLALLLNLPGILWCLDKIYHQFAAYRFNKRSNCNMCS